MNDMPEEIEIDDCWNRIGVWSRREDRCERLSRVLHCQNCEVFAGSARKMLNRPLPDDYLESLTAIYAQAPTQAALRQSAVVIFRLGDDWLALPSAMMREVVRMDVVHALPHNSNPVIRGLINHRGQLIMCISLGNLLDVAKPDAEWNQHYKSFQRMIVIRHDQDSLAFPVSEVRGIQRVREDALRAAPDTVGGRENNLISQAFSFEEHDVGLLESDAIHQAIERAL